MHSAVSAFDNLRAGREECEFIVFTCRPFVTVECATIVSIAMKGGGGENENSSIFICIRVSLRKTTSAK